MFIFIRKNGYYASQKRLCKQPVLRGGIFIAFSKRQFEVKKSPKIQLYQYVREWLDTGKKFSGLIKKSACLLLPLNIGKELKQGCNFFSKVITHLTELTGKFTDITLTDIQFKQRVDNQTDPVDAYDSCLEQNTDERFDVGTVLGRLFNIIGDFNFEPHVAVTADDFFNSFSDIIDY